MLYVYFWVISRRLNFICRRFETLCLFHFRRQVSMKNLFTRACLWRWNRQCSETSAYEIETPGNYPEENKKYYFFYAISWLLKARPAKDEGNWTQTTCRPGGKLVTDNLSARRETGHRQLIGQEGNWSQTTYRPGWKLVTDNLSARMETGHRQLIGQEGNWSQATYLTGWKLVTDNLSAGRFVSRSQRQSPRTRIFLKEQKSL
jgi:hypothetical protein